MNGSVSQAGAALYPLKTVIRRNKAHRDQQSLLVMSSSSSLAVLVVLCSRRGGPKGSCFHFSIYQHLLISLMSVLQYKYSLLHVNIPLLLFLSNQGCQLIFNDGQR